MAEVDQNNANMQIMFELSFQSPNDWGDRPNHTSHPAMKTMAWNCQGIQPCLDNKGPQPYWGSINQYVFLCETKASVHRMDTEKSLPNLIICFVWMQMGPQP